MRIVLALALVVLAGLRTGEAREEGPFPSASTSPTREWSFAASLEGRPIGRHVFRVTDRGDEIDVESRASFDVRLFGFSVYTYEHRATERWRNGCLESLDSSTDDNGDIARVTGTRVEDGFEVKRNGTTAKLPKCTMTFAYWNPAIRAQSRLLNPQTGDYLDVAIEQKGPATLDQREAERWTIRGKDLEIEVWYDRAGDRWLALDSNRTRKLSYRLE